MRTSLLIFLFALRAGAAAWYVIGGGEYGGGDYRITESSPARGIGTDLSAWFSDDFGRRARSVPWDSGAWEVVASAPTANSASVGTLIEQ